MASFNGDRDALLAELALDLVAFAPGLEEKAAEAETALTKVDAEKKKLKKKKSSSSENKSESKSPTADVRKAATEYKEKEHELHELVSAASSATGISEKKIVRRLKTYLKVKDQDAAVRLLRAQQTLSLCFVVDATGSMHMGNIFKGVCQTIRSIIGELQASMAHMSFELACVAYRDVGDGERRFQTHEFNGSITEFERFLKSIKASGGGDQCEDVIGGLAKASEMNFAYANKLLFLCADAPCHGIQFHDGCNDDYPDGSFPGARDSREVVQALRQAGVDCTFLRINNTTNKMIEKFNQDAGDSKWMKTCELDVADMKSIRKTIRRTIMESTSRSFTDSASAMESRRSTSCKHSLSRLETLVEDDDDDDEANVSSERARRSMDVPSMPMAESPVLFVGGGGGSDVPVATTFAAAAVAVERGAKSSKRERLLELKSLFDEELITKGEYNAQKRDILRER